ncbi:MAG: methyltransferase domain-containing protein [Saprospiraceae bacterium]|jgi:tRNA A58 N-methylase Trm61|nr:methyltransferase domain-containing protein [Saprospiraceae bacterium]
MVFKKLRSGVPVDDTGFDALYPERIQEISEMHFTPVDVAKVAASFLAGTPGVRVLDVGSGAGKFCLIGAVCTAGHFTGVEHRESLFRVAEHLQRQAGLTNTTFIRANILDISFDNFDAVYLFNPFYENMAQTNPIDDSIVLDKQLYTVYCDYVREQLDAMPVGTRLATYFSYGAKVPGSYIMQSYDFDRKLKMWKKMV